MAHATRQRILPTPHHRDDGIRERPMDGAMRAMLDAYVDGPTNGMSEAESSALVDEIIGFVHRGRKSVRDVVIGLERALTTTDAKRRARATEVLANVAERGCDGLDDVGRRTLCGFFTSRLGDYGTAKQAARGALACARIGDGEDVETIARGVFVECDVQSLKQSDREACYGLALELLRGEHRGRAARGAGEGDANDALLRIIGTFDGEKDPRCVLGLCEAWTLLPGAFEAFGDGGVEAYEANAEELYDVAASYFPVSFKPPRGDAIKISRRQLAEAVERAMTASPTFAPWAVSHVLESLNPDLGAAKMTDAARVIRAMGEKWGADVMEGYLDIIWRAFRAALAHPNATKMEDDDDPHATTPMSIITSVFAGGAVGSALASVALNDQCVRDAETTLGRIAQASSSACASEETKGSAEGCCGGGCGGGGASDEQSGGRLVVSIAGRVLGAVAAATPTLARQVVTQTLRTLFDAAKVSDGNPSKASYLALLLATPVLGGALDCCERHAVERAHHGSVLGEESERLVRLFSDAAMRRLDIADADTANDAVVLGLAGMHMLCKFPATFGLATPEARKMAASGLCESVMLEDDSEDAEDVRLNRTIEALVAAVSGGDEPLAVKIDMHAASTFLNHIYEARNNLETVVTRRVMRALVALSMHHETIWRLVVNSWQSIAIRAMENNTPGCDALVHALCNNEDGILTRPLLTDDAENLADFCIHGRGWLHGEWMDARTRAHLGIYAVARSEIQKYLFMGAFEDIDGAPLKACVVLCGLRPDFDIDVNLVSEALSKLANIAVNASDPLMINLPAAAIGSAVHKFPTLHFTLPQCEMSNEGLVAVIGACIRARAMRRDDSADMDTLVSHLIATLDDETSPESSRGAAIALSMAVGFDAAHADLEVGLRRSTHATEKFLARQRVFSKLAPILIDGAYASVGRKRLMRSYAVVKLASGVAASVALSAQFRMFALLPDVLSALCSGALPRDDDATRSALLLVGAYLSDPSIQGKDGGASAAEQHCASLIDALCAISNDLKGASMEARELALDAITSTATLPFSVLYPSRQSALDASLAALDDPKRRVRRAAARARQIWLKITTA